MSTEFSQEKNLKNKKIKKNKLHKKGQDSLPEQILTNKGEEDPRFAKAKKDPKFMAPSSKQLKTQIDKRFTKMLKDKSFGSTSRIDRYGRRIGSDEINNELKDYYYMNDEE